ncbi:MAG: hypothetical protein VCA34_14165 [Roseibacillus sp.]
MRIRRITITFRYMWTAWLNIIRWSSLATLVVFMAIALITRDTAWFMHVGIAGGVYVLALVIFLLEGPSVRCIGCGGTLLRAMNCAPHKTAKRIFGSYTLHCTLALATYAYSVHCPYCGMRYRISRSTRRVQREAEERADEKARAEVDTKEDKARKKSESKNRPYY